MSLVCEWDDLGANHIISDMCQSHDCRKVLEQLKLVNPSFKCTLFAIPGEMTQELLNWCAINEAWVELAVHGFYHTSNYECANMTYDEFEEQMDFFSEMIEDYFVKVFRAPGWQISDDILKWLADNEWVVADQFYNGDRRPNYMNAYINTNGKFSIKRKTSEPIEVAAYHGHVWDVGEKGNEPNGIYEDYERVENLVRETEDFKFITEFFT